MLTRLRHILDGAPRRAQAHVPDGIRVYAIGDIHGRLDLLDRLLARVAADAQTFDGSTVLVFLGDYVDRGLDSARVIDRLLGAPLPGMEAIFLKGNHEATLLAFLDDPDVGSDWLAFGGGATLLSYGVPPGMLQRPGDFNELQAAFRDRLPREHLNFLYGLRLHHRIGDYVFVHAGIQPGIPLERQSEAALLWIREPFLESPVDHGAIIVHGHTVVARPDLRSNRIGIDTGAYATGRLTALILEGAGLRFLHS